MNVGDVCRINVTNRAICPCGCENIGNVFDAVYAGVVRSDFGIGQRYECIDFIYAGCGGNAVEYIQWNDASAVNEYVAIRTVSA